MDHRGLLNFLHDRERDDDDDDQSDHTNALEPDAGYEFPDDGSQLSLGLKKRRTSGLIKRMMTDAGYGDLSKMVAIRRRGEPDDGQ